MRSVKVVLGALVLSAIAAIPAAAATRRKFDPPVSFQGALCRSGLVDGAGRIERCVLADDLQVPGGPRIPAGSLVWRRNGAWVGHLFHDVMLQGFPALGTDDGTGFSLFPSGRVHSLWLAHDTDVQGVPCREGGFVSDAFGGSSIVRFYEDGRLERCEAARRLTIGGRTYVRGDTVCLNARGAPVDCARKRP